MVLTAVVLAAGCSAGGGGGAGGTGSEQDAGPPQPGGTYRMSVRSEAPTLDPHKESSFNTHGVVGFVYSKLVDHKTGPDIPYGSSELEGDLAETWSVSPDGMTWTFELRQGVRFHDVPPVDGREFTSADVLCTVDRIRTLPGQQLNQIDMVDTVTAPDPYTVVFTMKEPFAGFDQNLAGHFMEILPCEGTNGEFDLETQAIGTGPFILETWSRDEERIYLKNPTYYQEGRPYLDRVEVSVVPDEAAAVAGFRTGELDAIASVADQAQLDLLAKTVEDVVVSEELSFAPTMLFMNQAVEPFDDVRVRRAVALAIDRKSMMDELRPGEEAGGLLSGPITPKLFGGLDPGKAAELQPYDPELAKQLLAEAGYPDGFEVRMILTDGYGPVVVQEGQWVQQDLAEVGIDVTLDVQDYATFFTESFAGEDYTMGYDVQTPMLSADEFLSSQWKTDGTRNWFNLGDPELDAMIGEQRGILDPGERETALHEIQEYIIENVSNPIFLYISNSISMYAPYVHDVYPYPDYGSRHMKDVWLGPEAPGRD